MGSFSSAGNFKWMKGRETKKSKGVSKSMNSTGKLVQNIIIKGKTKKAFKGYK